MDQIGKDVYLVGSSLTGEARAALLNNLAALFKKEVSAIERMLRKSHSLIKANVDVELAQKYKSKIEAAGGKCELVDHGGLPEIELSIARDKPTLSMVADETTPTSSATNNAQNNFTGATPSSDFNYVNYCIKCGAGLSPNQSRCPKCRAPVSNNKVFTTIIIVVGCLFAFLFILGILAAIALPQYQVYTVKSKIFSSQNEVEPLKEKVEAFYEKAHEFPNDNILIGATSEISSDSIKSIDLSDGGAIVVVYKVPSSIQDPTIIWRPAKMQGEARLRWSCDEGDMPNKYRPKACQTSADQSSVPRNSISNSTEQPQKATSNAKAVGTGEKVIESKKANFSLKVPKDWNRNDKVSDLALLVVCSTDEKFYAMVLAESKTDFDKSLNLQKYITMLQKSLENTGKNHQFTETHFSIKGGMPVAEFEMRTTTEGLNLGYTFYVVETDKYFYRSLGWTLQSTFESDKSMLEKVTKSLDLHD